MGNFLEIERAARRMSAGVAAMVVRQACAKEDWSDLDATAADGIDPVMRVKQGSSFQ